MKTPVVAAVLLLLPNVAAAGYARGQVGLDLFYAESRDAQPTDGIAERLAAQELGMRIRFNGREIDDRLRLDIDYRGREPVGGDIQNATLRLLYQGEISFAVIKDRLTVAAGRFIAPAALLLPVDGLRVQLSPVPTLHLSVFGGRRAISISRRNLGFDRIRPAVGGQVRFVDGALTVEVAGAYAEDQAVLLKGSADESQEVTEDYGSGSLYGRLTWRPIRSLYVGGQVSFLEQARYILGPSWNAVELDVDTFNVWSGNLFGDWRPLRGVQIDYTFHYQRATAYRAGLRFEEGGPLDEDQAPDFLEHRVRFGWRPLDLGWIRLRGRLRDRPDRQERRVGVSVRADRLGLRGLYVQGRVFYDDIAFDDDVEAPPDLDRLWWSAALGYRNYGLDAQLGARLLERFGNAVSGRRFNARQPGEPDAIVDLSPFTIQTQRILFLRAFYSGRFYFGGLDLERNIEDNEFRVVVQAGTFMEAAW